MSCRLDILSGAVSDMLDAAAWYEGIRSGFGDDFIRCAEETYERIRDFPEAFMPAGGDFRKARVRRFPYVVYFRVVARSIKIYAILHTSRHPRVWQARSH